LCRILPSSARLPGSDCSGFDVDVTWTAALRPEHADAYDRFVAEAPSGHFAQSRAWGAVAAQDRLSSVRFFLAVEAGSVVGASLVRLACLGPVPLPFARVERGPVCRDPRDLPRVLEALARAARGHGVARLSVMPYWTGARAFDATRALSTAGFFDSQTVDGAHAVTLRLDVVAPDDRIFAGSERAQLRHLWREAERAGVTVRHGGRADLEVHRRWVRARLASWRQTDKPARWYAALGDYLEADPSRGELFVAELGPEPVGTAVVIRHGALATYVYGATTPAVFRCSKSVLPLIAAASWARAQGCSALDLGGIPDGSDVDLKRNAIARFKRRFARTPVALVREHTRWF
jgi:hypothetical protein